jgi:arylsulfatase A-like enzyme
MTRNSTKPWLISAIILWVCCGDVVLGTDASARKPNIVYILSDDQGWADVGFHGSDIPTPNLDRLAKDGVVLARHYSAPVCSPTRAGLLTGRYWSRFGITVPDSRQCLPDGTLTIASVLKTAGYHTGIVGKWHLGGAELPGKRPNLFGFDYSYGVLDGAAHPFTHVYTPGGKAGDDGKGVKTLQRNGEFIGEKGHLTDLIAREAIQFMEQNKDGPFFLYVPFTAPHEKCVETTEWLMKCAQVQPEKRRSYAAMVAHMDDAIGRIVNTIDRLGLRDNTLIVFSSDNGGVGRGLNSPLRGKKEQVYEGGVRTLALANWPGKLAPATMKKPVCVVDWLPTFCNLAGATLPQKMDGRDIWPSLVGPTASIESRPIYLLGLKGQTSALVSGDWKLVNSLGGGAELYDLAHDQAERKDLASTKAERVIQLQQQLAEAAMRDYDAVAPEMLTDIKPAAGRN